MPLPSTGYLTTTIATAPGSAITDFSWLVDLSQFSGVTAFWTACTSSVGLKLRCALDSDETELPFDVWGFDNVGATGYLRIKVPTFTGTQTLRIYPSDSGNADYATPTDAYDANWLFYSPEGGIDNRTGTDGTANGGLSSGGATGVVGDATQYDDAASQYMNAAISISPPFALSVWANPDSTDSTQDTVISVGDFDVMNQYTRLFRWGANGRRWGLQTSSNIGTISSSASYTAASGTWANLWGDVPDDTNQDLYVNTNFAGNSDPNPVTWANFDRLHIGANMRLTSTPDEFWSGDICEVQIHGATRSAEWRTQEYSQTNDNDAFWGSGTWNAGGGGGGLSIPVARHHYTMQLQGAF